MAWLAAWQQGCSWLLAAAGLPLGAWLHGSCQQRQPASSLAAAGPGQAWHHQPRPALHHMHLPCSTTPPRCPPAATCRVPVHWDNGGGATELLIRPAGSSWHWSGAFPLQEHEDYRGLRIRHRRRRAYKIIPVNTTVGAGGAGWAGGGAGACLQLVHLIWPAAGGKLVAAQAA
jgi:hypothetical protein